ncbi:hypothetical protein LMG27198_44270 [Methylocystis echinoides]|uniref:Uncharacterized protein n=1 Tax=Methylocystis echinoides TaxID=29468 RepID=A0A9W6LU47_9HYPH|nr:hypothetical protein LMG27198_44270 [Methylocystis echinoides]
MRNSSLVREWDGHISVAFAARPLDLTAVANKKTVKFPNLLNRLEAAKEPLSTGDCSHAAERVHVRAEATTTYAEQRRPSIGLGGALCASAHTMRALHLYWR